MTQYPKKFSRRGVIGMLGAGAVGVAGYGMWSLSEGGSSLSGDATGASEAGDRPVRDHKPLVAGDAASRALVMIELEGGNDWMSTLVPYRDPSLRSLRDATLPDMESLIRLDDRYAINGNLASTGTGIAFLHGVGTPNPTGSHFEMASRWRTGDAAGTTLSATGFLGRLCDELDQGAPVTGVSLAGSNPAILSRKSVTLGLPDGGDLEWLVSAEPWFRNLRSGIEDLGKPAGDDLAPTGVARTNLSKALRFSSLLEGLDAEATGYPGGSLSDQLAIAAKLLGSKTGVRVILVSLGGFDTHSNQRGTHDGLLDQIDRSLAAFHADLARRGLLDETIVANHERIRTAPAKTATAPTTAAHRPHCCGVRSSRACTATRCR